MGSWEEREREFEFPLHLLDIYGFLEQIKGFALVLKELIFVGKTTRL
jgi:hypothetical protein